LAIWGSGNSIVALAVIGVGASIWCIVHDGSRLRGAAPTIFIALFVTAARQIMAFGDTSSGWHWNFLTQVVGWGLTLVLVTSGVGAVVSGRWFVIMQSPHEKLGASNEPARTDATKVLRSTNYLRTLVVLTLLVVAFSQATWLNIEEHVAHIVRISYRGDSNYGPGGISVVLGLVLLLVCVQQLRKVERRSPVAPTVLVIANLVALANVYVANARPPFYHEEILLRLQWGYFVTLGATLLSAVVLVEWWRTELAPPLRRRSISTDDAASASNGPHGTTTGPPRPRSE
jgi:hypothetical protein